MPSALLKPCGVKGGGCPELVIEGLCPEHSRQNESYRGSAASRGYDSHWSKVFRPAFFAALIAAGVTPVCGAALPDGPSMADSECAAAGLLNAEKLHVDHSPPLATWERQHRKRVEDMSRVGLLCRSCHARKTQRESR